MFATFPQDSVKPELSNDVICKALHSTAGRAPQGQRACRRIAHCNSMNAGQEKTSFDFMSRNHDEATVVSSDEESLQRPPKWGRVEQKWCRTCGADVVIEREPQGALRARSKKCLPLKCDKSLSGQDSGRI